MPDRRDAVSSKVRALRQPETFTDMAPFDDIMHRIGAGRLAARAGMRRDEAGGRQRLAGRRNDGAPTTIPAAGASTPA